MEHTRLILVRHGQSEGNTAAELAASQHLARIDVPARDPDVELTELGREQAASVGRWLGELPPEERPTVVWTSPYARARTTGEIALDRAGIEAPTRVDERLRDRDMGITDMLTAQGIREQHPGEAERRAWLGKFYYRPPGGESWADVAQRVRAVMTDLAACREEVVLVTAHDVVNLLFCYVAEGMDEATVLDRSAHDPLRNAAVCILEHDPESATGWTVLDYNLTAHLDEDAVQVTAQPGASDEVEPAPGDPSDSDPDQGGTDA